LIVYYECRLTVRRNGGARGFSMLRQNTVN
jgi:hypothetical protein